MIEEWRDVLGYEGLYEVSDQGRVRRNGKILKPGKNNWGYLQVFLSKNEILKTSKIHRLVASAFIPNPQNLPEINHKDENKTNNCLDNLEWCTHDYNTNYGTRNARAAERISEKLSKPVLQFDKEGNFIREWPSIMEVERELGINNSNVSKCCLGRYGFKTAGGFVWRYKN